MKLARALLLTYTMLLSAAAGANGTWVALITAPFIFAFVCCYVWLRDHEN